MLDSQFTPLMRYGLVIGTAILVLGGSAHFFADQTTRHITALPSQAKIAASIPGYLAPIPELSARDLDASRIVPAVVAGNAQPTTPPDGARDAAQHAVALAQPSEPETTRAIRETMRVVTAVNVRSGPSKSNAKIAVLSAGEEVEIIGTRKGWVHFRSSGGVTGWVYGRFLAP